MRLVPSIKTHAFIYNTFKISDDCMYVLGKKECKNQPYHQMKQPE